MGRNMQVGINLLCLSGIIEEKHLSAIERLKALGYDDVEVPVLRSTPDHDEWLSKELDALALRRTSTSVAPAPITKSLKPIAPSPSGPPITACSSPSSISLRDLLPMEQVRDYVDRIG